jgi:Mn2+/Fe2+ NRAMP family transporter
VLFSLGIIGTGLLAIPILAASGAYAVKEFFGVRGGLADKARYRPFFYGVLALGMLGGLAMNFVGIDPIKALFATAVINGLVAPPLLILITLLGSDRRVMGEHASGRLSKTFGWLRLRSHEHGRDPSRRHNRSRRLTFTVVRSVLFSSSSSPCLPCALSSL